MSEEKDETIEEAQAVPTTSGDDPEAELEELPDGGTSIVGFILIPLLIVMIGVGIVFLSFTLAQDRRSVEDYAREIRSPNKAERWQAVLDLVSSKRGSESLIPILIEMLDTPPEEQEMVQWAPPDLLKNPEEKKINLRWYATAALGTIGGARAEEKLLELLEDKDGGVRLYAVHAFGRIRNPEYVPKILERLKNDEDRGVRTVAAYALGEIADPQAKPALLEAYEEDGETDVRWNAAIALARLGEPSVRPTLELMEQSRDVNPSVRSEARKAIRLLDRALVSQ